MEQSITPGVFNELTQQLQLQILPNEIGEGSVWTASVVAPRVQSGPNNCALLNPLLELQA